MKPVPPLSLIPLEIITLAFLAHRITSSEFQIEKITSIIAFGLHLQRFIINKNLIIENSKKNWKYCILISLLIIYVVYNIIYTKTSLICLGLIAAICQILGYYVFSKNSNIKFKMFNKYIDIPIMILSIYNFYLLYKTNNRFSIVWSSDIIYHIWEIYNYLM